MAQEFNLHIWCTDNLEYSLCQKLFKFCTTISCTIFRSKHNRQLWNLEGSLFYVLCQQYDSYVMHIFINLKWARIVLSWWSETILLNYDMSDFCRRMASKSVFVVTCCKIDHSKFKIGSCCQTLMDREFSYTRTYTRQQ